MRSKWDLTTNREEMGRFARKLSERELLVAMRAVAEEASPGAPEKATQKAFDNAREPAGYPHCPRAQSIVERLSRPWPLALELAFNPNPGGQAAKEPGKKRKRPLLTKAEIINALTLVARALSQEELTRAEYDRERERLVSSDERGWAHGGGASLVLPSSGVITAKMKTWDQALELAGLGASELEREEVYPNELALDDFISDYGWAPTRKMLVAYQHRRGMSVKNFDGRWLPWVREQLESGKASRHGDVEIVKLAGRAPAGWETHPISPAPEGYAKPQSTDLLTISDAEAAVNQALDLAGDQDLTQKLYRRLATSHRLMSASTVQRVAKRERNQTFGEFVSALVKERAKQPRQQGRVEP